MTSRATIEAYFVAANPIATKEADTMGTVAKDKLIEEPSKEEIMRRNREAMALVEGWLEEDPSYDLETLPLLRKALDESRAEVGARQLFPDEDTSGR